MKNSTKIKIPKKYEKFIEEVWYEGRDDGYWVELLECCVCDDNECHYIHEYTQKDILKSLQSIRVMDEKEYLHMFGDDELNVYYEDLKKLEKTDVKEDTKEDVKEPTTMIFTEDFDGEKEDIEVELLASRYWNNNVLYLGLIEVSTGEIYLDLTINLESENINESYLDVNNVCGVDDFIEKYKLGTFTGKYKTSGFCKYPLYSFDLKEIEKYTDVHNIIYE